MVNRALRHRWQKFHDNPELRGELPSEIRDSWERSYQHKIDPYLRSNPFICSSRELLNAQKDSEYLISISSRIMDHLLDFVKRTGFVIALMDSNLCIIKTVGDEPSLNWAKRGNFVPGSLWKEELIGTNSVSMASLLGQPFSVFGYEHFCLFSHVAACSTAPIIDQQKVIGNITLAAPFEMVNSHTLGLTRFAAKYIKARIQYQRMNKYHEVVMDSLSEGILVIDSKGMIVYANQKLLKMLDINRPIIGEYADEVFAGYEINRYLKNKISSHEPIQQEDFWLKVGKNDLRFNITAGSIEYDDPFYNGYVLTFREGEQVNRLIKNWIGKGATFTFDGIIGNSPIFKKSLHIARAASMSDSNVLLLGESGTGKDIVAQAIHSASKKCDQPFVAINCASLPRELLASELFGYEEGAFTGAKKGGNIGKFELANHGTIFLDEIGDMPVDLQAALLRVIEEKSFMRVGGNKLIPVDVRIIAATNKNLEKEIANNHFRRDLYYRLAIIKINLPPLRERKEDIMILAQHFIKNLCNRLKKPLVSLSPEVINAFCNYHWPGNVRELQNIIEGSIQLSANNEITYDLVESYFHTDIQPASVSPVELYNESPFVSQIDKNTIIEYLQKCQFNKTKTAEALGISRRTLYRRLKEYELL